MSFLPVHLPPPFWLCHHPALSHIYFPSVHLYLSVMKFQHSACGSVISVTGLRQTIVWRKHVVYSTGVLWTYNLIMKWTELNIGKAVLVCCNLVFLVSDNTAGDWSHKTCLFNFVNFGFNAMWRTAVTVEICMLQQVHTFHMLSLQFSVSRCADIHSLQVQICCCKALEHYIETNQFAFMFH